jgi:hypothetical protein
LCVEIAIRILFELVLGENWSKIGTKGPNLSAKVPQNSHKFVCSYHCGRKKLSFEETYKFFFVQNINLLE